MPPLQVLVNALMASSEFSREQISKVSLPIIREILYRIFSIALPVAVGASMLFSWYKVNRYLAVAEAILLVLLLVNSALVFARNRRLFSNLAFCSVVMFFLISPIIIGFVEFIYFCLICPVLFYVLVERRAALTLNVIWLLLCSVALVLHFKPVEALCYFVSHIAIWMFVELLFYLLFHNEKELKQLAVRDPLTGCFNRRAMENYLDAALLMRQRYDLDTAIIMLDIDHFKAINDTHGHKEGDLVLKNLAALLDKRIRRTDKLCRYGGEEFVLILSNCSGHQAMKLAESIRDQVRSSILTSKRRITISCGVAEARPDLSVADWLHRVDIALYRAKQAGRDRVEADMGAQV